MLLSKSIFKIKNKEATLYGLSKIKGVKKDKNNFIWLGGPFKTGTGRTILGMININDGKMILECNSKERLKKGKELILANVGSYVDHKTDTFQDINQALEEEAEAQFKTPKHKKEIPDEAEQEAYSQFMQKHYEDWLNESIPALNKKTPLEAIKTRAGKEKVSELLKSIENTEERNKKEGKPFYDLYWLRKKLKL